MSFKRQFCTMIHKIGHDAKNQEFCAILNAFLSYQFLDDKTIDYVHTEVPEEFRGTGLAMDLAKTAFDYAFDNQLKMKLTCEYLQYKLPTFDSKYKQIVVP